MEAALSAYRKRCGELFTANVLLEARIDDLEQEVAALRAQAAQQEPAPPPEDDSGDGRDSS